ncbi:MAG: SMP-30/gluconolactonase/LRE family protein [Gammaproteobacteria bacterium]|nr:SMP-30/gluconolactonase/LRE family protein [Gammaproteobacteria bacterium]MBT7226430.1 SMP-30/gluconolactonase/LRE family protein [Gammaproteobacteria bacterium]
MRNPMRSHCYPLSFLLFLTFTAQTTLGAESGLIADDAQVVEVQGGFAFIEGPVSDAVGNLYFTDIDNNRLHKLAPTGDLSSFHEPSNRANGLTLDLDGGLLICEQEAQRLVKMDANGNISVIADGYQGKPFNSPNDAWVHPNGSIYMTDPRYQYPQGSLAQDGEYVYRISPQRNEVTAIITDIPKPNGVVGTEDGKTLYIASTELRKVFRYTINEDGSVANRTEFADQGSDGMTLDEHGNVYLTWLGGVSIRNPSGEQIDFIRTEQMPANVGFGGRDGKTLFMTARTSLYSLQMIVEASR